MNLLDETIKHDWLKSNRYACTNTKINQINILKNRIIKQNKYATSTLNKYDIANLLHEIL